jgi:hypothetical protein
VLWQEPVPKEKVLHLGRLLPRTQIIDFPFIVSDEGKVSRRWHLITGGAHGGVAHVGIVTDLIANAKLKKTSD